MPRICIYFKKEKEQTRFIPGDAYIIPLLRQIIKGRKIGGVEKVFINLCKSFDKLKISYLINPSFSKLKPNDRVIILGTGKNILKGYQNLNKIIAGIGLMTHPSEWPNLCEEYPVVRYLQHCDWATNVYKPYYGKKVCANWFAGIDTEKWKPVILKKDIDILIYNKVRWNKTQLEVELQIHIITALKKRNLNYKQIDYGNYEEREYFELLKRCKAMIFLCEHESQGFACCEAMSMNVPILAWDQGFCLDPNRFEWGEPVIPATSVPFFDQNCGMKFKNVDEFKNFLPLFFENVTKKAYEPRRFVIDHISLEKSGNRMLELIKEVYE